MTASLRNELRRVNMMFQSPLLTLADSVVGKLGHERSIDSALTAMPRDGD